MIKIYYGLSGTFKGTTINSILKSNEGIQVCYSDIKKWKRLDSDLFGGATVGNNYNYSNHHFCKLEHILSNLHHNDLLIERGVSDFCFYQSLVDGEDPEMIKKIVRYEEKLLSGSDVEKILLIQEDEKFIGKTILSEPTRSQWFPDVESYRREQNKYIKFTKEYNKITSEVVIRDAEDYIVNKLGLRFDK